MWRRYVLVAVALLAPGVAQAQDKLAHLLPAGSQVYLHWDGVAAHQADADKLAVMKMWKGETGDFVRGLWKYVTAISKEAVAGEIGAELADAVIDEFGGLLTSVGNKGFALGAELQSIDPIQFQVTLVFPNGAGKAKSPLSFMETMSKLDKEAKIKTVKQGQRTINYLQADKFYFSWWGEGKDAVWSVGTTEPGAIVKNAEKQPFGLAATPLYKEVHAFKEFPAWLRGYFDLPSVIRVASKAQPVVKTVADAIGLDTIVNVTFYSGFDGPAERAVMLTKLDKGGKLGFMKLFSGKNFSLKDLPPMPADLHTFSAATLDWPAAYDVTLDFIGTIVGLIPVGAPDVKQIVKDFEKNNNVSIGAVFGALDQLYVAYSASAEGPLGLGQVQLIKVRDEKKFESELGKILRLAEKDANAIFSLKVDRYHGVNLHTMTFSNPADGVQVQRLSYVVHKGWVAVSQYPQPLKGFILRANGELPAWKPSAELADKLKPFPAEFCGITVSDPRPAMKFLLSVLPAAIDFGQMALEQSGIPKLPKRFDLNLVPNAYEATRHLFPNITITTMQGDVIRAETRSSLMLPF